LCFDVFREAPDAWQKRAKALSLSTTCGYIFKDEDWAYRCNNCATDPTCCVCAACFQDSSCHELGRCMCCILLHICHTRQYTCIHTNLTAVCTVQHTATHCNNCNTLQHNAHTLHYTAAHCTTLQHTALHCSTLQHTAAHCNTLKHTATHCSTLLTRCIARQHTATHCNTLQTLQHTATYCSTLQHTATHYSTLQHTPSHCNILQHTATHRNTQQHTATHSNTPQHSATHRVCHTCCHHRA